MTAYDCKKTPQSQSRREPMFGYLWVVSSSSLSLSVVVYVIHNISRGGAAFEERESKRTTPQMYSSFCLPKNNLYVGTAASTEDFKSSRVKKTRFDFTLRVISSSIIHYRCEPESFAIII